MIKCKIGSYLFPACGRVAMFTTLFKLSTVRVQVTGGASCEFHVSKTRDPFRDIGFVTFFASNLEVYTGQWISRFGVVEMLCRLPIGGVVATSAILTELPFVVIHVAGHTLLRQSHIGLGRVFALEQTSLWRWHIGRGVAFLTLHSNMGSIQKVASQAVIELSKRRLPVDEVEISAVVFEVATHAVSALGILH